MKFYAPSYLIPPQSNGKMSRHQIHLSQEFLLRFLVRQASSHSPPTLELGPWSKNLYDQIFNVIF